MRDFTLEKYSRLVSAITATYEALSFRDTLLRQDGAVACIRHDIDRRAHSALACARICADAGAVGTFYFRYPYTFDPSVLRQVAELGHEVGYHYETLTKTNGDMASAVAMFRDELAEFRRWVQVDTVCMHGSPLSRWDNRDIWTVTTLEEHGLIGEPYLSLTPDVAYATDTGRGWNRRSASIRDAMSGPMPAFASTAVLIRAMETESLGPRLMVNIHPERWNDALVPWTVELLGQTAKNQVKSLIRLTRRKQLAAAR